MQKYDLSNLTSIDFEELCKDILEYQEKKEYRTFAQGKDGGVDLLSIDDTNWEVGQAKHYKKSTVNNLISSLKKEKTKILKLENMKRYILFTSLELTIAQMEKIIAIFEPFLKLEDIYDNKKIQNILNEEGAKYIVNKWEKLWMPTPFFLKMIYDKFKNREYEYKKEEIIQDSKKFVKPSIYNDIIKSLEDKGVIILHGEPGAGKTTLAKNIIAKYISEGYEFIYGHYDELHRVNQELNTEEKVIVLIDDFLGTNVMSLDVANDGLLEDILKRCYKSKNKKVVLTTRTYIYNNGIKKLEKFGDIETYIDKFLLASNEYTLLQKARILYNHLFYNGIMEKEEYQYFLEDRLYYDIIKYKNFNPKTIGLLCEHFDDICKENTKKDIIRMIKNPDIIWEKEYEKLNKVEKILLHTIIFFGSDINENCVEEQFSHILKSENIEIEDDIFRKSESVLINSFVKRSINNEGKYVLSILNNNIVDFIIKKIEKNEIKIQRYVDNALYIDVLRNMYDLLLTKTALKNEIVNKLEKDFCYLKHTKAYWLNNVFCILEDNCYELPERVRVIKNIIDSAFEVEDFELIEFLLEKERSEFYEYILMNLYESMDENNHILINSTYIYDLEQLMIALNKLEKMGLDISFIEEAYDIFIKNLIIAVTNEVENDIKIDICFDEDLSEIWSKIADYVMEKVENILDEHYFLFEVEAEEIYQDVLQKIIERKDKINTKEFKEEAEEQWGDLREEDKSYLKDQKKEIIKMFENKVLNEETENADMDFMEVRSYIKIENEIIELSEEDKL